MLRLAFDFIITWRETRTRPNAYPRGKMLYFAKEELDAWLLQNYEPTVDDAMRMATEVSATQPFFNQKRYGKRKKN